MTNVCFAVMLYESRISDKGITSKNVNSAYATYFLLDLSQ